MDHIVVRFLTKLFDLMLLNILWVFCSLPLVTVGASTTALYSVALKMAEHEEGYIVRGFWKAFKRNFKQSTIVWLILAAVGVFLGVDFWIVMRMESGMKNPLMVCLTVVAIFYCLEVVFVFPLIAKFENGTVQMLKNAILIPTSRFPVALLVLILDISCVVLTLLNQKTLFYGAMIWTLLGAALLAYAGSFLINSIFRPYMK